MQCDIVHCAMVFLAPAVYKQFNKPTLTISHSPCKIKLDASTLSFAYFTWLGAFVNRTASYLRTLWPQQRSNNCMFKHPFRALHWKCEDQLKREKLTPASHIYGTSRMSVVEPVSRKRTCKVGPDRFINSMPLEYTSARQRVANNRNGAPVQNTGSNSVHLYPR